MQRGEVWWAQLPPPVGRRPVVLLSRNRAYERRASVTVAPLTRTIRGIRTEVPVGPDDGVPADSVVNLDDIGTIPKGLLESPIALLSHERMSAIRRAIMFALDL